MHEAFDWLTDPQVSGIIKRQPLIRLVTDTQDVVSVAQIGDHLELLHPVNLLVAVRFARGQHVVYWIGCAFESSSAEPLTFPSGLFGVLMTMALVRGVNLLASSSAERTQSALESVPLLPLFVCVGQKQMFFPVS